MILRNHWRPLRLWIGLWLHWPHSMSLCRNVESTYLMKNVQPYVTHFVFRKALRSLLLHKPYAGGFADEVLRRAFVTVREINTSNSRFFEVVAEVVCSHGHDFVFSQVVCLGMSNLCHPLLDTSHPGP